MEAKAYKFEEVPNLINKIHKIFFIANQKLDLIRKCDNKFKDTFYKKTYDDLALTLERLGVIMRDTHSASLFVHEIYSPNEEDIVTYMWSRYFPDQLIEKDNPQNKQSYSEVLGLKPYTKQELVPLSNQLEIVMREYNNLHRSFINTINEEIVDIHDVALNSLNDELQKLSVLSINDHEVLIFCEDGKTYLWDMFSPKHLVKSGSVMNNNTDEDIYI